MEDAFEVFARNLGTLTADDSVINTVVPMDVQYLWSDKYRPRKPRVFNKVHTVRSLRFPCCRVLSHVSLAGLRLESIQQETLRYGQSSSEDGARLQIQCQISFTSERMRIERHFSRSSIPI